MTRFARSNLMVGLASADSNGRNGLYWLMRTLEIAIQSKDAFTVENVLRCFRCLIDATKTVQSKIDLIGRLVLAGNESCLSLKELAPHLVGHHTSHSHTVDLITYDAV